MSLQDFTFSQTSLQDFVECPQRFYLRYILNLAWPAIKAAPPEAYEAHLRRGQDFHHLVHQRLLGLPDSRLTEIAARDSLLELWWDAFRTYRPADLPGQTFPEVVLTATVAGQRLLAKYDLLLVRSGERALIFDWKTNQRRPNRAKLEARLQTRVYRYLLAYAGAHFNGGQPWAPRQIEMIYWFPAFPNAPIRFPYHEAQYRRDQSYLTDLITHITHLDEAEFRRTEDERRCRFCPYRSYCDRGSDAGTFTEADEELLSPEPDLLPASFDFEQIAEVEF